MYNYASVLGLGDNRNTNQAVRDYGGARERCASEVGYGNGGI